MRGMHLQHCVRALLCTLGFSAVHAAFGGPLLPPVGPVAPTHKTLTEVEPRIPIGPETTPGSTAATFVIDQPGSYYLVGNLTGETGKNGINVLASNVTIDLRGFALNGVAGSVSAINAIGVNGVRVYNGRISGWRSVGVRLGAGCHAEDLSIEQTTLEGIVTLDSCIVSRCIVRNAGSHGYNIGFGAVITHCIATECAGDGFIVAASSAVVASVSTSNEGNGFDLAGASTISRCTATFNGLHGFTVFGPSNISHCEASFNGLSTSTGAGILLNASDNRIDSNNCTSNDRGIRVVSAGNFITRNTCSGNSINWDIVAGNVCLVVNAATSGAISGNSGGTAPGSTDPNANFTY